MARNVRPLGGPKLSELEWEIMKPFWESGAMAARDLYARVGEQRRWSYKTVKTMLARLVQKGALKYEQIGNSYLYEAAYDRDVMTRAAASSFVERVFDGALTPFLAFFAERATPEELAVIRQELKRIESKQERKVGKRNVQSD